MSQSNSPTFTCFPNLPKELQLQIYEYMMPEPRRVHMKFRKGPPTRLGSNTPIPVLLHLNRDARYEALKKYQLHFGSYLYEPNVYFNPETDTLYFGPNDQQRQLQLQNPSLELEGWRCHVEHDSATKFFQKGCGHHELDFFWKNIAGECEDALQNIGIDLRMNQGDILHFFHSLHTFKDLKKTTVFCPHRDDPMSQTTIERGDFLFGWKMWQICGVVKLRDKRERFVLEAEQLSVEGVERDESLVLRRDEEG